VPTTITTRPRQSTLTFQSYSRSAARPQVLILEVSFGGNAARETVMVWPGPGPVLNTPGRQAGQVGVPLSFVVSAWDSADAPVTLSVTQLPEGATFDERSGTFAWVPRPSHLGNHDVLFTATSAVRTSTSQRVAIDVGPAKPIATALVNAASQSSTAFSCSPGTIVSLLGSWLVEDNSVWSDASGAMQLGGTTVKVNANSVPLLYASGPRVDLLCPHLSEGALMNLTVTTEAGQSDPITATILDAPPGIFSIDGSGHGQGAVLFAGTSAVAMARNPLIPGQPAQPGDHLAIRVTGVSRNEHLWVTLGGITTPVESMQEVAGNPGLYEVLVSVPGGAPLGDAVPVGIQYAPNAGEVLHSNVVTMAIEPVRP
jgi:uncharacterized protein (TIGR03437 family)